MIGRAARRAPRITVALIAVTATTIAPSASHGATTPATATLSGEASDIVERALSRFGQCPGGTGFDVRGGLEVYAAIFHGDIVRFARLLNEDLNRELEELEKEEKAYTLEKRRAAVQRDPTMATAFKSVAATLKKASFCALADGRPVFKRGQFWAVVSSGFRMDGDKLLNGVLFAPEGVAEEPGDDELTVGGWKRFSCMDEEDGSSSCGVALAGLPRDLKDQIETESGTALTGLWRWTGLPRPQRSNFLGFNGFRFRNGSAILWAPQKIRFELRSDDALVWTLTDEARRTEPRAVTANAPSCGDQLDAVLLDIAGKGTQAMTLMQDAKSARTAAARARSFESAALLLDAIADESGWSPPVASAMRVAGARLRSAARHAADDSKAIDDLNAAARQIHLATAEVQTSDVVRRCRGADR